MGGELSGLKALVTGAGSGIGLATARMLAERGAVVGCLDLDVSEAADEFAAVRADVSEDSVGDAAAALAERLGGLDILVNNAGVMMRGTVEDADLAQWREVFEVNVFGMVRVTRGVLPWLRASAQAAIVNNCSLSAVVGLPGSVPYASSKGAVYALTLAMAADHLREGIRVNCVIPGPVDTPWVRRQLDLVPDPEEALRRARNRQPNGRLATAQEVAAAICYLAGPLAAATTGSSIRLDGGTTGVLLPTLDQA